jgi:hypothetical protein
MFWFGTAGFDIGYWKGIGAFGAGRLGGKAMHNGAEIPPVNFI